MNFTECVLCDKTVQESKAKTKDGKEFCKACYDIKTENGNTVEVPKAAVERLISMAQTRHPTVCNEDAYKFEKVLREELN